MKNAETFWMEVTTRKATKSEAKGLYNELIQKDIDVLEREKIDETGKKDIGDIKKHNILSILNNLSSIFTVTYLHYKNMPKETIIARSITERTKLGRGRSDEIERKEQKISNELFKEYFTHYQSPSNMCKKLSESKGAVNEV